MISGAHAIIYSKDEKKDRAFFRDVLGFPYVDAGQGWHIFALPPSELAVHPNTKNNEHELYLTCDDLDATMRALQAKKARFTGPNDLDWGRIIHVKLPGGGKIGVYQPKHPLAHGPRVARRG